MKDRNTDALLKKALNAGAETPRPELVLKTKNKLLERDFVMKKNHKIKYSFRRTAVILIAMFILTASTVFAIWNLDLLKPSQIAGITGGNTLMAAFESDSAININESITSGGYTFTLLAIVSGKDLKDTEFCYEERDKDERTYAVLAIQKADGAPFTREEHWSESPEISFLATPLVKGLEPWRVNVFFMNGGLSVTIVDGIVYHVVECDTVEMFADRGLYFAVSSGFGIAGIPYNLGAFNYDEQTGEITANPDFDGISVIFDLPLEKSLADPEKAEEYLQSIGYYEN